MPADQWSRKAVQMKSATLKRVSALPPQNGTHEPGKPRKIILTDPNLSAIGSLDVTVAGTTPMIVKRFSEKAQDMMLGKQMGRAQGKRAPKKPEEDFLDSFYCIGPRPKTVDDLAATKFGVPAIWFKCAMIRGAKINDVAMTDARTAFFVETDHADLVSIECPPPRMRMDPVRQQQTADIRVRSEFSDWSCKLRIRYNARAVSVDQLVAWLTVAGQFNGLGEWRPNGRSSTGTFGCFKLVEASVVEPKLDA